MGFSVFENTQDHICSLGSGQFGARGILGALVFALVGRLKNNSATASAFHINHQLPAMLAIEREALDFVAVVTVRWNKGHFALVGCYSRVYDSAMSENSASDRQRTT